MNRFMFGSSLMIQLSRRSYRHHVQVHFSKISTLLHKQLQSIRFILAAFGLAPAAGMNALNTLIPDNLWHCRIRKTKRPLWGTKTGNISRTNAIPQTLTNYHFIGNMIHVPYTNRTQTLLFPCRRNVNFRLIRTLNRQKLHSLKKTGSS